jgi:hypothetical protein
MKRPLDLFKRTSEGRLLSEDEREVIGDRDKLLADGVVGGLLADG